MSVVELERMMVMRERTVANLDQPASCQYPDEDAQPQLDPRFWQKLGGRFSWRVKPGVKASAAIKSIYAEGDNVPSLLRGADKALYAAKGEGRGRYCVSGQSPR